MASVPILSEWQPIDGHYWHYGRYEHLVSEPTMIQNTKLQIMSTLIILRVIHL